MQITMGLSGNSNVESDILQVSNMGFQAYILALRGGLLGSAEKVALHGSITELKEKTIELTNSIVTREGQNITNNLMGNNYISTQVYNTNYLNESTKAALENDLSTVDLSACIDKLRECYNMKAGDSFNIIKLDSIPDIDWTNSVGTKMVSIDIFSITNGQRLNKSICNDNSIVVKIPIQNNSHINQDVYASYRNQSIDIYNPDDPMFTSRCYTFAMNDYDTTINMRRRLLYTNYSITCQQDCIYNGIQSNYIQCSCSGLDDELTPRIINYILDSYDDLNIDIIKCVKRAFNVYIFNFRKV
jgi:hypothetical protein